jgi:hypothetical protein
MPLAGVVMVFCDSLNKEVLAFPHTIKSWVDEALDIKKKLDEFKTTEVIYAFNERPRFNEQGEIEGVTERPEFNLLNELRRGLHNDKRLATIKSFFDGYVKEALEATEGGTVASNEYLMLQHKLLLSLCFFDQFLEEFLQNEYNRKKFEQVAKIFEEADLYGLSILLDDTKRADFASMVRKSSYKLFNSTIDLHNEPKIEK